MKFKWVGVLVLAALTSGTARGEDLVFFRGTKAGSAAWVWNDARVKERKKPGLKGARKAPTYTKR